MSRLAAVSAIAFLTSLVACSDMTAPPASPASEPQSISATTPLAAVSTDDLTLKTFGLVVIPCQETALPATVPYKWRNLVTGAYNISYKVRIQCAAVPLALILEVRLYVYYSGAWHLADITTSSGENRASITATATFPCSGAQTAYYFRGWDRGTIYSPGSTASITLGYSAPVKLTC